MNTHGRFLRGALATLELAAVVFMAFVVAYASLESLQGCTLDPVPAVDTPAVEVPERGIRYAV